MTVGHHSGGSTPGSHADHALGLHYRHDHHRRHAASYDATLDSCDGQHQRPAASSQWEWDQPSSVLMPSACRTHTHTQAASLSRLAQEWAAARSGGQAATPSEEGPQKSPLCSTWEQSQQQQVGCVCGGGGGGQQGGACCSRCVCEGTRGALGFWGVLFHQANCNGRFETHGYLLPCYCLVAMHCAVLPCPAPHPACPLP